MRLNLFYGPGDLASAPADKPFDIHHTKDKVWVAVINESNFYWDILREDQSLAMVVGRYMQNCVLLDPRERSITVHANGQGANISTAVARLFLGFSADMPFVPALLNF